VRLVGPASPLRIMPKYKRVVVKFSGEALGGPDGFGLDLEKLSQLAAELAEVNRAGVEIGVVIGGGNFFRGAQFPAGALDRVTVDEMGMLATVINGLALRDQLEKKGVAARLMSAIDMPKVAEPYVRHRALRHLEKGRIVIFAAGTSHPYFSTDTAAVLRALEVGAQIVGKATRVEGVYDKDPLKHPDAVLYDEVSYHEVLSKSLQVMDATAVAMCRDNRLPILVFNGTVPGNIMRMAMGEPIGTLVH